MSAAPVGDCSGRLLPGVGGRGGVSVLGGGDTWILFEWGEPSNDGTKDSRPRCCGGGVSLRGICTPLSTLYRLSKPLNRGDDSSCKLATLLETGALLGGVACPLLGEGLSAETPNSSRWGGVAGGEGAPPRRRAGTPGSSLRPSRLSFGALCCDSSK
jgi:hypothetical protein